MLFFGSKDESVSYGLLIDVSSGSIGIGIVESNKSKDLPKLIYADRTNLRVIDKVEDLGGQLRRAREALLASALTFSHEGISELKSYNPKARITKIFVTCSSPWAHTVARSVQYTDDEPFKVTKNVIDDLIQTAEKEILLHVTAQTELGKQNFEVVENATVDISINDYIVTNPFGLSGKQLSLSHIAGLIPKDLLSSVEEVQEKLFKDTELRAHTYMLVMYCVMRDIFPTIHSSCIVDVTGEATEFGIVEQNLLIDNVFIQHGTSSVIRNAAKKLKTPEVDIRNQLISYNETVNPVLKDEIKEYQKQLVSAITQILQNRTLPNDIIVTSHSPFTQTCKQIIEDALSQASSEKHKVITIEKNLIEQISEGTEHDAYLAISARFFHKLHGCADMQEE